MAKAAAKTGGDPTALVAVEQCFPKEKCIIQDDLAYQIIPSGRTFVWMMKSNLLRSWMISATEKYFPGIWGGMMCRKRYIDEKLMDSVTQIDAVVNLGAGFDTRAYRMPVLSKIPVWEVDQPQNIKAKKTQLQKIFGIIPSNVKLVEMDFDKDELSDVLQSYGYSFDKKTFFIWEAVSQYLTEDGIRSTFDFLSKAASGSKIAFTYVRKDFLEGKVIYGWEIGYKRFVESKLWLFGMNPDGWPSFLSEYGWRLIEDVGYDELAEKYIKPTGRNLASTQVERMVYAGKM